MRAEVSSGRSDLDSSWPTKLARPVSPAAAAVSIAAEPPVGGRRLERGRAHGDDLDLVGGLHGRQRVAGIDGAHEGVGALDRADVGDLLHVEQGGGARHHVLAGRGGRRQHVAVVRRQPDDQLGEVFGEAVGIGGVVGQQHLGDAGDLRGLFGDGPAILAGDQQVDVAADLLRGGNHMQGGRLHFLVVMFDENEIGHDLGIPELESSDDGGQMTLASLRSLSTSSATDFTFTPDLRFGGSTTFRVLRRGAASTPSASGVSCSIGFFFAFMMLGSEA